MIPDKLDSLTPSERLVLFTLLDCRDQKAIARELDLSPETVKTHLRNAREKTGIRTSFALARALAEHDRHTPDRVMPHRGGGNVHPKPVIESAAEHPEISAERDAAFHEDRMIFDFEEPAFLSLPSVPTEGKRPKALSRLLMIAGLTLLLILIILLAVPLSDSFQRFADVLDPPKG
jgi:DNA-binding CsgD family transcriptional regulator